MGRLEKLRELECKLYISMQTCESKELAAISRQYRETIKEIEEIEGRSDTGDEIAKILQKRDGNGESGAVR